MSLYIGKPVRQLLKARDRRRARNRMAKLSRRINRKRK
jgi:hypothetical protein